MEVNGKEYPLWSQFIERKGEWIGGVLSDSGDGMDYRMGYAGATTIITDIELRPNGDESAFFEIIGEDFSCGFDVRHGGISGERDGSGGLAFNGYGGHSFKITQPERAKR